MKKTILIIVSIVTIICIVLVIFLNTNNKSKELIDTPNSTFYNNCIEKLHTKQQEASFDKIISDTSLGYGEWKRDVLILIGDLPKNTPRVTIKDAESLLSNEMNENDYIIALNKIAGAPDWQGGSGIGRAVYFLDNHHKEAIIVTLNSLMYVVYDEKRNSTEIPLGDQQLPEPKPTH